ncbi:MAG TPA: amidohydrolase family protein [Xanthobacteraceae bacterium]|jgi:predicted TIM-barrel fold metal-dependent hydrolase
MAIDMHSHYYGGLIEALRHRTARPRIAVDAAGRNVLHAMTASTMVSPGYTEVPARLRYLDSSGIRTQLMTFPGALGMDVIGEPEVSTIIRNYNDELAAICRASGGRLLGLAGLPLADMGKAAHELRRVRRELGLLGAILPGNLFLSIERAERLRPVFAAADELGALLMIHPGLAPNESAPGPFPDCSLYRASVLALQASIAQMGITLVCSDLLDRYPNAAIQLVNLGGTLPFVLERIEAVDKSRRPQAPFPSERLRRLYYDCASLGPRALQLAVKTFGADRIMLGTDYPIFELNPVADTVGKAEIDDDERDFVLRRTAESVISRLM